MATVTRTYKTDDIDGSEDGVETIQLALDGTNFEIDLSEANAERLREKLERFVNVATPVKAPKAAPAKRGAKQAQVRTNREHTHAIREWAKQAGITVSERGRLSAELVEKYNAEH